jgi:DNA polymerase/3'-5' exonuclease PolX
VKTPMSSDLALNVAERLIDLLTPVCDRIEIAGSLRRGKPEVGDIDLLLIPQYTSVPDLFGVTDHRYPTLDDILSAAQSSAFPGACIHVVRGSDKMRELYIAGVQVDLWFADPATWGCRLAIRTGSSDFSHWLVTSQYAGGATPFGMRFKDARLWRGNQVLDTPSEEDVFAELGLGWIPPVERRLGRWSMPRPAAPPINAEED